MTALYRKYRPQHFEELVGQEPVRITLLEALRQNRLVHAYLFSGPRGTGKTTTARLIAKAILCENRMETGEPCATCEICTLVAKGELIDLIEIDAASNRGIDEIRDLREKIRFAPTRGRAKVYIIDEVHMLTKEAFNALLKSLEEPPEHVYFILATTELHKIPETILSRCQRYDFKRISEKDIVAQLTEIAQKEKLEVEPAALELLAKAADGGMRDAISLLEQLSNEPLTTALVRERLGLSNDQSCEALYVALGTADTEKGLALIAEVHREGHDLQQFTTAFLSLLRSKLHEAVVEKKSGVLLKLLQWTDLFDEAWMKLKRTSIATLPLEIAVIRATQSHGEAQARPEVRPVAIQTKRPESLKVASMPPPLTPSPATPTTVSVELSLDFIQKHLSRVYGSIGHPSVRASLQSGRLKSVNGHELHFSFGSQFHFDKVKDPPATVMIEEAFKKILNQAVSVFFAMEPAGLELAEWETVEEPLEKSL